MPDSPDYANPGATIARNCLTQTTYYKPFPSFGELSESLPDTCVGYFSCRDTSDNVHIFAGTREGLYKYSNGAWTDVTRLSSSYSTANDGWWSFTVYGNRVIATNLSDDVQSFVIGASTEFDALAGNPPRALGVTVVNNFILLFGLDGNIGRVQWSGLDDPTDWTPSAATQSDFNDILGDGGKVQGAIGSQNVAVIVMEKQIWRMDYVGPDTIFTFTLVEDKRGTPSPRSVTGDGIFVYYLGENGFYSFNGSASVPIGHNKVDRYFSRRVDTRYMASRVVGVADPTNKTVLWAYPNEADSTNGDVSHLLAFNWQDNRWTEIEASCQVVGQSLTLGLTMEELGVLYATMEDVPFSLDSQAWQGGQYVLGGINTSGMLGYFNGDPMTATIATSESQLNQGGLSQVQGIIPVTDASSVTARVGSRMVQSGDIIYSGSQTPHSSTGEANFRVSARFHRAEISLSGTWNLAQGVQFRFVNQGVR